MKKLRGESDLALANPFALADVAVVIRDVALMLAVDVLRLNAGAGGVSGASSAPSAVVAANGVGDSHRATGGHSAASALC